MLLQGLVLLVAGVSIVFLFLSLLVVVVSASSKVITRFNHILPDEGPKVKKGPKGSSSRQTGSSDEEIAVAVAAALARQRGQ